ncbi:PLP-dependent transferase, partial [Candidatus Zixiibacteriota bacterium]
EVGGGLDGAIKVIDSFKLIANAGSLGGVESMACLPALTSHFGLSAAQRQAAGISEGMIRLSVGLESPDDLCADLDQALGA